MSTLKIRVGVLEEKQDKQEIRILGLERKKVLKKNEKTSKLFGFAILLFCLFIGSVWMTQIVKEIIFHLS